MKKIGEIIRKQRKELGLSQEKFGMIMGVQPNTISDIELGKKNPSKTFLAYFKYRYLDKTSHRVYGELPGWTIGGQVRSEGAQTYEDAQKCPFKDSETALLVKMDLVLIEEMEPGEYRWIVEKIYGKATYLRRQKKSGGAT